MFQELLSLHQNDLHALVALDSEVTEEEVPSNKFKFRDIFQKSVLHPFLVILVLMFLLQFSGQGAITFYTVQIFTVSRTEELSFKVSIGAGAGAVQRRLTSVKSIFDVKTPKKQPLMYNTAKSKVLWYFTSK